MSRRSARMSAYQLIFGYLFSKEIDEKSMSQILESEDIKPADSDYIRAVVYGVRDNYSQLMEIIADNSKNFKVDRIFRPDLF